jgi:hypothetical protein
LRHLLVSLQSRLAAFEPSAARWPALMLGAKTRLRSAQVLTVLKAVWLGQRLQQTVESGVAPMAQASRAALRVAPGRKKHFEDQSGADTTRLAHCDDSTEGDYVHSLTFTELFQRLDGEPRRVELEGTGNGGAL